MQHLGRPYQCWLFVSYAARQITALNFHSIRRLPAPSDLEHEIYSAVYWCYYLDSTLSSLLCRPPSLPSLETSPSELILLPLSSPYNGLLHFLLDLAQIQRKLQEIPYDDRNGPNDRALETCQLLDTRMREILPRLQSVSSPLLTIFGSQCMLKHRVFGRAVTAILKWFNMTGLALTSASMRYSLRFTARA